VRRTLWFLPLALPLVFGACVPSAEVYSNEDVCREAAIAAARRTVLCTDDVVLGNTVGDTIGNDVPCKGGDPVATALQCPIALGEALCEDVPRLAANPPQWLSEAGCQDVFEGLPLPDPEP
jgi:hypothetical protein